MKKLLTLLVGFAFVTGSLLAQTGGGSTGKAAEGKQAEKDKKGHKGGKKSKKGSEGTTPAPK